MFNRFDRWVKAGKWERLFLALQTDRDDEWHGLESTIHRARAHRQSSHSRVRRAKKARSSLTSGLSCYGERATQLSKWQNQASVKKTGFTSETSPSGARVTPKL